MTEDAAPGGAHMTKLYRNSDLYDAVRQRNRLLYGYLSALALFLAGLTVFVVFYCLLPYDDPSGPWYIVGTSVWTALFIVFSFPYMGISFKRSNAYAKMLKFISVGLKEYSCLVFSDYDDWMTKDGVDVNVAVFEIKNIKRDEPMFRQIYVDGEKPYPEFKVGYFARIVTQGNLLIEYEFTDRREENE